MIGNEITLTTKDELKKIYGIRKNDDSIYIGKSLIDGQEINIPVGKFFASHIGIFGNTGSGKSNTLHKLYLELFRSEKYIDGIIDSGTKFFLIDFNGEYVGENLFNLNEENKKIIDVNTRKQASHTQKVPIKKEYLFDADILSILFDARPATQVPFLRNSMKV